ASSTLFEEYETAMTSFLGAAMGVFPRNVQFGAVIMLPLGEPTTTVAKGVTALPGTASAICDLSGERATSTASETMPIPITGRALAPSGESVVTPDSTMALQPLRPE